MGGFIVLVEYIVLITPKDGVGRGMVCMYEIHPSIGAAGRDRPCGKNASSRRGEGSIPSISNPHPALVWRLGESDVPTSATLHVEMQPYDVMRPFCHHVR